MGKVKRKHRVPSTTYNDSTLSSPSPSSSSSSSSSSSFPCSSSSQPTPQLPFKSVSPSARSSTSSLSSCSSVSSTSSLSSPPSKTPSPNHHWSNAQPPSLLSIASSCVTTNHTQSPLINSSDSLSYILSDDDSGLGFGPHIEPTTTTYNPLKVARFNPNTIDFCHHLLSPPPSSSSSSSSSSSLSLSPQSDSFITQHDMLNLTCKPSSIGKRLPHSNPILSSQHLPQHQQPSTSNNGYSTGSCHLAEYVPPSSLMNEQLSGSINQLRPRANLPTSQTRAINNMLYHPTTPLHPKKINGSNNNTNNIGFNNSVNRVAGNCSTFPSRSKNGKYELKILSQPEEQHRARYLTEGSRGAIKDKSGHGYPVIKLCGYMRQPIKIQCFIGHDKHIGTPHLFYQASRIAGKNSTNCQLKKVDGTSIILMEATPSNNMEINVDCIGILKERNVDVEQKLNKFQSRIVTGGTSSSSTSNNNDDVQQSVNNIKRSTRCRLVFRCEIPETGEILQAVSVPILCTQPLGTPEINKKSTDQCDINGGVELFIIGKNFLKDAKVIFRNEKWIKIVEPNREYLKSTHLICMIPPFDGMVHSSKDNRRLSKSRKNKSCASNHLSSSSSSSCSQRPMKAYELSLMVKSGGKCSEPHRFFYTVNGQLDTNDVVATTDSGEVLTLSSYDTESTNNTMMDSLIDDNSCLMKESSPYINHQGQQQQQQQQFQLETNQAISHSVDVNESSIASTSNSPIGIGSNAEMTPQLGQDVLSPIGGSTLIQTTGPEQILDQQSNSATVQVNESPSVLQSCMAAAAVVAANEVQALSNSNQLTAANLHQTVTTAAAVAVAATEAVLADNSPSSNCGLDSQQASQTIPNPPNQSAVALVAAQINSMIPYLTISDTASALAAAAAIKQEPEPSTVPSQTVTQPGSTYMTMPSHDTNTFQPNLVITPSSNSQSTIATSPKQQQQQQLQSMMIEPNETMKTETNHIGLMNQFGTTDADVNQRVHTTITSTNVSIGNMSMETNPISFAALNHQATTQTSIVVDPMATLKVDTLTLNDKVQLPQLTLSDINNQLSIPSVVATTSAQMNMIPIETVMNNEKPVIFSSEIVSTNNHINLVKTVTLSDGSMVSMTTAEPTKQEPSSASSASVIMGPSSGYQANLVNHHMQLSSTASDYNGLISSDLIVNNNNANNNNNNNNNEPSPILSNTNVSDHHSPSYQMNSNQLMTTLPSPTTQSSTSPSSSSSSSLMMDTLPSTLSTQNGMSSIRSCTNTVANLCTSPEVSVINSLNTVESVSLPGLRGPVQFTDNVEMGNSAAVNSYQIVPQPILIDDHQSLHKQTNQITSVQQQPQQQVGNTSSSGTIIPNLSMVHSHHHHHHHHHQQQQQQQHQHQQQQQQQQQATNICTFSTLTDAELINFINPATFE